MHCHLCFARSNNFLTIAVCFHLVRRRWQVFPKSRMPACRPQTVGMAIKPRKPSNPESRSGNCSGNGGTSIPETVGMAIKHDTFYSEPDELESDELESESESELDEADEAAGAISSGSSSASNSSSVLMSRRAGLPSTFQCLMTL